MEISLPSEESLIQKNTRWLILVASLGYFVDIYDLLLFIIVRIPSLKGIGITSAAEITSKGTLLLNIQMAGLLAGGFIWGIIGDKKGRLTVLFGSILLYSLANVLNGFVHHLWEYGLLRFLAGFGLAGELGAGITLVSETMKKEKRGYGTMLVATIGILGAVVASFIAGKFDWRTAFWVGGGLGFILLILRIGVFESGIYSRIHENKIQKGSLRSLFGNRERRLRYIYTSFLALPIWFIIGILMAFGREFGIALHMKELVSPGLAISYAYFGGSVGNLLSGALSQWAHSRKRIIGIFIPSAGILIFIYLNMYGATLFWYYTMCFIIGISTGFWVLYVTVGAEQFGTNLRATAATSLPNIARGYVIPLSFCYQYLAGFVGGILHSAALVGGMTILLSAWGLWHIQETYGKDLDFLEN